MLFKKKLPKPTPQDRKKKQTHKPNTQLMRAESVRQRYLRYGVNIANQAMQSYLSGGIKGLRDFQKQLT